MADTIFKTARWPRSLESGMKTRESVFQSMMDSEKITALSTRKDAEMHRCRTQEDASEKNGCLSLLVENQASEHAS